MGITVITMGNLVITIGYSIGYNLLTLFITLIRFGIFVLTFVYNCFLSGGIEAITQPYTIAVCSDVFYVLHSLIVLLNRL